MKRFGGVTAYGMPRNLFTVAVEDGRTVVVPMTWPGPSTAVGTWLVVAVAELNNATKMTDALPNMLNRVPRHCLLLVVHRHAVNIVAAAESRSAARIIYVSLHGLLLGSPGPSLLRAKTTQYRNKTTLCCKGSLTCMVAGRLLATSRQGRFSPVQVSAELTGFI